MIGESPSADSSVQSIVVDGFRWLSVERPTVAESDELIREFDLQRSDVEAALDRVAAPGVWQREAYVVVTLQVPVITTNKQPGGISASPVAIFIGRSYVLTVHTGDVRPLLRFFRQCESEPATRQAAFADGTASLVGAIILRLLDAAQAVRGRIERNVAAEEERALGVTNTNALVGQAIAAVMRLRSEARLVRRLTAPLPDLIRGLGSSVAVSQPGADTWEKLAGRAERLVHGVDDDLVALDGVLLATSAVANVQESRYLRALIALAALTLPVIAVATLIGMPIGNPLNGQPNGFSIGLAIDGLVFLVALIVVRQTRIL